MDFSISATIPTNKSALSPKDEPDFTVFQRRHEDSLFVAIMFEASNVAELRIRLADAAILAARLGVDSGAGSDYFFRKGRIEVKTGIGDITRTPLKGLVFAHNSFENAERIICAARDLIASAEPALAGAAH